MTVIIDSPDSFRAFAMPEKKVNDINDIEEKYMKRAIALAKEGEGSCHPNPLVGAVLVKDGMIIGEGYHKKCGDLHAERNAILSLNESAEGSTMYVNLEPCCHYGKTPPCTEAIIEDKIARVVIGSRDPNPQVAGKGVRILRDAGIKVTEDFMRDECDEINKIFFHYITKFFKNAGEKLDIVFIDPPYSNGLIDKTFESISENDVMNEYGIIIAEHTKEWSSRSSLVRTAAR